MSVASPRPAWAGRLDRIVVTAFVGTWLAALIRFAPALARVEHALAAGLGALAGYLLADLLSGSVHWLADRYFEPDTPLIGPLLIAPFREHHADASEIARHDFFEVSGNNALVTLPLVLVLLASSPPDAIAPIAAAPLLRAGMIGLGLGLAAALFLTNQLHCWAHTASPPPLVRRLQARGWILSRESHALHHRGSHDRAYCVTSGWLNPLLDRIHFFSLLEGLISTLTRRRRRTI